MKDNIQVTVSVPSRGNGVLNNMSFFDKLNGVAFPSPLGAMGSLIDISDKWHTFGDCFRPLSGQWGP